MDEMAERARALGGHAVGTLSEFLKLARLKEQPGKYPNASQMTAQLLAGHEALIRQLRGDVESCGRKPGDAGTADFLTGVMEQHEKMAWMLRAILEENNRLQANGAIKPLARRSKMNRSKCPHCGAKLANFMYADACPHCHEELKHNTRPLLTERKKDPQRAQPWVVQIFFSIVRFVES